MSVIGNLAFDDTALVAPATTRLPLVSRNVPGRVMMLRATVGLRVRPPPRRGKCITLDWVVRSMSNVQAVP